MNFSNKIICACCGYKTILEEFSVCPVCFWEHDIIQEEDENSFVGANNTCLFNARLCYRQNGYSHEKWKDYVRNPNPDEIPSTCRNCKFWRLIREKKDGYADDWKHPHGECGKITEQSTELNAWVHYSLVYVEQDEDPEIYVESSLITHPDFGCNFFESK